jgi:hypothetical protein
MRFDRPTVTSFEESELDAAVRRAWGTERAPAELRQRVLSALTSEALLASSAPPERTARTTPSPAFWRHRAFGWATTAAAAAALLIGIALAASERFHPAPATIASAVAAGTGDDAAAPPATFPTDLAGALVRTHDGCLRVHSNDHHLFKAAPKDGVRAIAQGMSARLHHPVIAAAPVGDGWEFRGAAICPVGNVKSAHLIYARDDAAVSIFSLPASIVVSSCPDHQNCDAAVDGHPMAGFVENGGFFCVVATPGHASLADARQVKTLRDQLHGQLIAAAAASSRRAHEMLIASMTH